MICLWIFTCKIWTSSWIVLTLTSVFLFLCNQVLEIYLQILLTTAQPKRGSELCASVELWLAEVTSTEFSGNRADDCSFVFFLMLTFQKSIWDSFPIIKIICYVNLQFMFQTIGQMYYWCFWREEHRVT